MSKRSALLLSVAVIVLGWVYQILTRDQGRILPADFTTLVWTIVRTKIIVTLIVAVLLRLSRETFTDLGVTRLDWRRRLMMGLGIGVVMFVGLNVLLSSAMDALFPRAATDGPLIMTFFKDPRHLLVWLPIGVIGGGVVEELQRIFVITRFEKWLGAPGLGIGVVLSSVMFGVGHLYQGVGTALATSVSGLVFALVYLRRRSAIEPMTAHALSDVLAMIGATLLAK